jgi:proteasome assembly chaperone 2
MWNKAFIPVLGPSAFQENSDDLTTASEFFVSEKDKVIFLQTRTPCTAALLQNYFEEILKFIKDEKICEVIILTSTFAHEQHFIGKSPFEFRANEYFKQREFPGFTESSSEFSIPGCGFALNFHQKVTNELQVPSVILYSFVSEGDNFLDSIQMCNNVNNYLKVIPTETNQKLQVKIPISWKFLFGRDVTREIY